SDAVSRRWLHMLPPDLPIELVVTPVKGAYPVGASIAEHGTPYDDDAHVPLIFFGPGILGGRYAERALVADAAPTLARLLGETPTAGTESRWCVRRRFASSTSFDAKVWSRHSPSTHRDHSSSPWRRSRPWSMRQSDDLTKR